MHKFPPKIVGVLNITPNSFSAGGKFLSPENALEQARELKLAGADILDVGAEASGPGSKRISAEEEWSRLSEILGDLSATSVLSIDT